MPDTPGRSDDPESPRPLDQSGSRLPDRLTQLPDGHPSSPRNEDGSRRPPAVSLKDLELPLDDISEAWRKEVPGFRAAWEGHLERWPDEERTPVDRSNDKSGSWRSDAGHLLTREQIADTHTALEKVREAESKVTGMMKAVETAVPGAALVGLDDRLKGEDRFKEKVAYEAARKPDQPVADIIDRIPDKIRYTCQFSAERYTDGYWDVHDQLENQGNELMLCKNAWDGLEYKGINTRWQNTEGQTFEVQFHTPDSFEAKQITHKAYERLRSRSELGAEGPQLEEFQRTVTSKVEIPDRATDIPDYRREGY